jgi:hypothetical protein
MALAIRLSLEEEHARRLAELEEKQRQLVANLRQSPEAAAASDIASVERTPFAVERTLGPRLSTLASVPPLPDVLPRLFVSPAPTQPAAKSAAATPVFPTSKAANPFGDAAAIASRTEFVCLSYTKRPATFANRISRQAPPATA